MFYGSVDEEFPVSSTSSTSTRARSAPVTQQSPHPLRACHQDSSVILDDGLFSWIKIVFTLT